MEGRQRRRGVWIATIADLPLCSNPTLLMKTTCSVKWLKLRERGGEKRGCERGTGCRRSFKDTDTF